MTDDQLSIPFARRSDTSKAAAESQRESVSKKRAVVLRCITDSDGLTCDEVEALTGWPHQTVSARINDLHAKLEHIVDSGERRVTRSGRKAVVWKSK